MKMQCVKWSTSGCCLFTDSEVLMKSVDCGSPAFLISPARFKERLGDNRKGGIVY